MPSRVKSLELIGFKTFASRTFFEFSDNITAIVGPNGSGKSNVADSLRWVLGEQSFSLMRAKKTEDMIFSGSESRPRVGMASATITFDNSDGWLPIEFSEVEIARRAYRNGENEYLINGQRVRLKDLVELLAQSGLSERTYTVIGQGLVDAALSLKAGERRRLFEEAAGIGLFRSRREETVRRLDITLRNLERVQDILAELKPRLQSLERQAKKSREYEQIMADLRVMLREWYGYQWHQLQRDVTQASKALQEQEFWLEEARKEQEANEEKLTKHRNRIQQLRANLNDWHRELAKLHAQRETVGREVAIIEERIRLLTEQRLNAKSEIPFIDQEVQLLNEQLDSTMLEIKDLMRDIENAETNLAAAQEKFDVRQSERQKAQHSVEEIQAEISSYVTKQGNISALISDRKSRAEKTEKLLLDIENEIQEAERALKDAVDHHQSTKSALEAAKKESIGVEDDLEKSTESLQSIEQELKQIVETYDDSNSELTSIKARIDVLKQAESSLIGFASGARTIMEAANKGEIHHVLGSLITNLEVPRNLEAAIAASLGEFLDAILIKNESNSVFEILESASGRAALIPLADIRNTDFIRASENQDEGVLGVGSKLVICTPEIQPIVDLLLGGVLVVKDRRVAKYIAKSQPAGIRVVTLRGEVFHATGPILVSGGLESEGKGSILGRAGDIRDLEKSLKDTTKKIKNISEQKDRLEERLGILQHEQETLLMSSKEKYRQWQEATSQESQAELTVRQKEKMLEWHKEQWRQLEEESDLIQKDTEKLTEELQHLERDLEKARENAKEGTLALQALSIEEYQSEISHWSTIKAVSERALQDAKKLEQGRIDALEKSRHKREATISRQEELSTNVEDLEKDKTSFYHEQITLGSEISSLHEKISPTEQDLSLLEQDLSSIEKVEATSRQRLGTAERLYAQTRINYDRKLEATERLRQRIEDDFGLVSYQYSDQVSGPSPLPFEGLVEELPIVEDLPPDIEPTIHRQRMQLRRMGAINFEAQEEYQDVKQRYEFLTEQFADLQKAEQDMRQVIHELDVMMKREFNRTFQDVSVEFRKTFSRIFGGGSANLELTDPDDLTTSGIDIEARLPGQRTQGLAMLSGGERSLTASALIFSLIRVSPTPFCVLDEVDAMLDEVNVGRFRELLRELSQNTQFIIITHNRHTIQVADIIYGVTMGRDSTSQVLSLKLDEIGKVVD